MRRTLIPHFILIIVSFPHNGIVHGVVHQVKAPVLEFAQFVVTFGKEADIIVGGRQFHAPGLGGIHLGKRLLHMGNRVGVFQLISQLDHLVINLAFGETGVLRLDGGLVAGCQ